MRFLKQLCSVLEGPYSVDGVRTREEFEELFTPYRYDLLLLDLRLGSAREGLELAKAAQEQDPLQPVIVMTAYADTETHIEAIHSGALVYLDKTRFSPPLVAEMVNVVLQHGALQRRVASLENRLAQLETSDMIGTTPQLAAVKEEIRRAATDGSVTVLVRGESGTGKELVARSLHTWSSRRKPGPFVAVPVAGLHKETLHSDLFGHEKGAFTGASHRRKGFLEQAHQGVLFLDEIGDLDPAAQVKLLRVLETRSFNRLGGNKEIHVDIQVVAATHQDLESAVEAGRFRRDLYYRLRAFEVTVPPLRDRSEDIPRLALHFLEKMASQGRTTASAIQQKVMRALASQHWKGNVRELKNVVEYAAIQARASNAQIIDASHLPIDISMEPEGPEGQSELPPDYRQHLARAEVDLIHRAIGRADSTQKTMLSDLLGYNDRSTFHRRIKRILGRYPKVAQEFPDVAELFSAAP